MINVLQRELEQARPFTSVEEEAFLGLQVVANRIRDPWAVFLRSEAKLTHNQYNVLRILRGAHPEGLTCSEISDRMISRDPDVTRLVDRMEKRKLVRRQRDTADRRVVRVFIGKRALTLLERLDGAVQEMPRKLLGPVGQQRLRALNGLLGRVLADLGRFP